MSGLAMITTPPQDDDLFKLISTSVPQLGSHHCGHSLGSTASSNKTNKTMLGQIVTILTSISGHSHCTSFHSHSQSPSHSCHHSSYSHSCPHAMLQGSPPKNTLLTQFLKYTATEGVPNATMYEFPLMLLPMSLPNVHDMMMLLCNIPISFNITLALSVSFK